MRIKEKIIKSGKFWLHSNPDNKVAGILSIFDGGEISLETNGMLQKDNFSNGVKEHNRIVGVVENLGYVTLENCFYTGKNIYGSGVNKSTLSISKLLTKVQYDEKETIRVNTFRFSIEGLDKWINITGITSRYDIEKRTCNIDYLQPDDIVLKLNNGMDLFIGFEFSLPGYGDPSEARISQNSFFRLESTDERNLDEFIAISSKITYLMCFAMDEIVSIDNIILTNNSLRQEIGDNKSFQLEINLYYPSSPYLQTQPNYQRHNILFNYDKIKENFSQIINWWIDAYDKIPEAINLYFSAKSDTYKYIDGKFLALTQSLESFHRNISDEKLMPHEAYEKLSKSLLTNSPQEYKEWLISKLKYGNEISLRKRIKHIIEPFKDILGNKQERDMLISQIVDTRNYRTHYDLELKPKASSGKGLWSLNQKIEAILQLRFLLLLGFNLDEIKEIIKRSQRLRLKISQ